MSATTRPCCCCEPAMIASAVKSRTAPRILPNPPATNQEESQDSPCPIMLTESPKCARPHAACTPCTLELSPSIWETNACHSASLGSIFGQRANNGESEGGSKEASLRHRSFMASMHPGAPSVPTHCARTCSQTLDLTRYGAVRYRTVAAEYRPSRASRTMTAVSTVFRRLVIRLFIGQSCNGTWE